MCGYWKEVERGRGLSLSDVYQGDPLAIRTITRIREIAQEYATSHGYEYVVVDTSPSLGTLNKVIGRTANSG